MKAEASQIICELRDLGEKACTCQRLGDPLGKHAFLCVTRQVQIRLDRLQIHLSLPEKEHP